MKRPPLVKQRAREKLFIVVLQFAMEELLSKDELSDKFGWEEYLMFGLLLALSVGVGLYFWWKGQEDNSEFLTGGKEMGLVPIVLSLIVR